MNFWFYFLLLPLLLGVALTALAAGSRAARWIYVDVHQQPGGHPEHIFLGFPLPLETRRPGSCAPSVPLIPEPAKDQCG